MAGAGRQRVGLQRRRVQRVRAVRRAVLRDRGRHLVPGALARGPRRLRAARALAARAARRRGRRHRGLQQGRLAGTPPAAANASGTRVYNVWSFEPK